MKSITLAVVSLIVIFCQLTQGQQKVTIDCGRELLPRLTIKRGDMFRAETNEKGGINDIAEQGYDLYVGHRNYNDPLGKASSSCGKPSEFYKEGGKIKFRLNPNMVALKAYAKTKPLQAFQQFNRTPLSGSYKDAKPVGQLDIFTFQQGWYRDGKVKLGRPDGLLPIPEQYELFADLVSKYMIACDAAAGCDSVWTGYDEPAHTLGFREGQDNNEGKEENVRRYVEFFAPLAIKLKKAGKTIGGIQLNGANAAQGLYSVATEELKKRGAYVDYFTIQNYMGGKANATIIKKSREALSNPYWKNTKVFFSRYGYWKGIYVDPDNVRNTSREMVEFLEAEKTIVDNADIMYGYAMEARSFSENKDKMLGQIGMFLNQMPEERKQMKFESPDLDGFSSANGSLLTAVVFNKSGTRTFTDFELQLSALPAALDKVSIRKGSGTVLSNVESYQWDKSKNIVSGIVLKPYDFLLITLK